MQWIEDSSPGLSPPKFFLLHIRLWAGWGGKGEGNEGGSVENLGGKGCVGKVVRKRKVTWGNDERLEVKWEGIKQAYLWLLFLPAVSCALTFSSLFNAKKSADCFNTAITVVARVSCISWAWGVLGFSGRKLYYNQRKRAVRQNSLRRQTAQKESFTPQTFMKDLK